MGLGMRRIALTKFAELVHRTLKKMKRPRWSFLCISLSVLYQEQCNFKTFLFKEVRDNVMHDGCALKGIPDELTDTLTNRQGGVTAI